MKSFIGIDFGACNIKAAKVSSTGKIQKIKLNKNQSGGNVIPNVILYEKIIDKNSGSEKIEIKVGKGAKNNTLDLENKIWQIKPKLSQKNWSKYIKNLGREVTAFEAVKDIFEWLWKTIIEKSSKDEDYDVTITVPVSFSEVQKNLIKQAAIDAGIPVTSVIMESFAAMFSLEEFLEESEEETVLIFDFGGSTLDLSLFKIERNDDELNLTELAAAGLKFGGIDIDKAILENIFKVKYADDVEKILQNGTPVNELKELIERMKEAIFIDDGETTTDSINDNNGNLYEFTLTPEEIISVLEKIKIKEKIIFLLDELFDDAEIDKSEVTAVKPFGGTVSIDYFLQMLTDYFGEDIFDCDDLDKEEIYMGIAVGAAKYGYIKNQNDSSITIQNVIPYSIGLVKNETFNRYIKRNELSGFTTPLKSLLISELEKNNWRVSVYQSFSNEFDLPLENEEVVFIGDVELDKNLYTVNDAVLFNLRTDGVGKIYFKTFELQPEKDEPVFVEEKIVKVGG
ncbi:MAG: Hsp70 family protein [Selenomonadaceae bacterium]|nr:Hsp70 family protein [Selenomonadaceae bacterium]